MLRSLVLILLLVNAAFFAWTQGWLNAVVGIRPDGHREPQRLSQQLAAQQIEVVVPPTLKAPNAPDAATPAAIAAAATDSAAPSAQQGAASADQTAGALCLEAGPFAPGVRPQLEALLRPVIGSTALTLNIAATPGLWMVYMGPYADADMLARKQDELRRIRGLDFEPVLAPANLALGISLGRYTQQAEANAALERLRVRGIRTARVVILRPAGEELTARVPRATAAEQQALTALVLPQERRFSACR